MDVGVSTVQFTCLLRHSKPTVRVIVKVNEMNPRVFTLTILYITHFGLLSDDSEFVALSV